MKERVLLGGVIAAFFCLNIEARSILDLDLESFLEQAAQEKEKAEFRTYYSQFLEKESKARRQSKQKHLRRLRSAALRSLRQNHVSWYKEVEPHLLELEESTEEARKTRLFLTRFALLEEYRHKPSLYPSGWWDTTKEYVRGVGRRVVSLKERALGRKASVKA